MNTPANRLTFLSLAVLAFGLTDVAGWFPSSATYGCFGGALALSYLVLACSVWILGLRRAGRGIRRWLFLAAFAAPLVQFGMDLPDIPRSAREGFAAGWDAGNGLPVAPRPQQPTSLPHVAAWLILTALLARLLDRLERREGEIERQKELAREARAQAIAGKLAPHFIFNALNTLHAQIESDPRGAQATTERLAALFREVVQVADLPRIRLRRELDMVEAYLGIEKARLGDRLRVSVDVPEPLETAEIPPLSLQVLVENAVKHGVAPREEGGEIRIGAVLEEGGLRIWVEDPGEGVGSEPGTGTALDTLRRRLARPEDLDMGLRDGRHRASFRWAQA